MFVSAFQHHQAGRLTEAEQLYRQVLAVDARHADSLHLLGILASQVGRYDVAIDLIGKAVAVNSDEASYHSNLGNMLQAQGRLDDAAASFRRAISLKPEIPESHYNLGNALKDQGRFDEAIDCYSTAIKFRPNFPEAHGNLGIVLEAGGRLDEAIANLRRALELRPNDVDARFRLANIFQAQGRLGEAISSFRMALDLKPDEPGAYNNLGLALQALGNIEEAVACFRSALTYRPDAPAVHNNLGLALQAQGKLDDAAASFRRALALKADLPEAHNNLGGLLQGQGRLDDAEASYRQAIILSANYAEPHNNLGNVLRDRGRFEEAIHCYRRALAIKPAFPAAHNNLGNALQAQGQIEEAVPHYRTALALKPDFTDARSNFLMSLHYAEGYGSAEIFAEARRFAGQVERAALSEDFCNDPDPVRRLRIGYVSGDFRAHPVGYFLTQFLSARDPAAMEVFCYSNSLGADATTARLKAASDHWRSIAGMSDGDARATIQRDRIDILVDLSGHTAMNRLPLFALRPAPVQVTGLGYFGTTGLVAMDYILADRFVAPEGDEQYFTEAIWRLPDSYLCFSPPDLDIAVGPPPSLTTGSVTFGCFNNRTKISAGTVALWARVLNAVPNARLFLKSKSLAAAPVSRDLISQFAAHGVASDRIEMEGQSPRAELLASYNRVDIALDPFPFGGGVTTGEALWMGVPVVTLRGDRWVGRVCESILATLGLSELVAGSTDAYVAIAASLAADPARLTALRSGLRARLVSSPFCDGPRFARSLEAAYRAMWTTWCGKRAIKES